MGRPELLHSILALSKKIDRLLESQKKLQTRIQELEISNENLTRQHEIDQKALKKAKQEVEFLSLSHRLASSPEALISARNEISRLIRTIDNCIRLINED